MTARTVEPDLNPGIRTAVVDRVLRVEIRLPRKRNALSRGDLESVAAAFESAHDAVDAAVLTGRGDFFCAGADLTGVADLSEIEVSALLDAAENAVRAIRDFPGPVIAAVNGPAVGVGVSLALACDLTVATRSAYFMLAFTRIGLMPDGGATWTVPAHVGRAQAMRIALLADRVDAEEAGRIGLISRVYDDATFAAEVEDIVARLQRGSAFAYRQTKKAINAATLAGLESAFSLEREGQLALSVAPEFRAGVAAFNRRGP